MDDDVMLCLAAVCLAKIRQRSRRKRLWSRQWLQRRREESVAFRLLKELREEDQTTLIEWTRLTQQQFQDLLAQVTPLIKKEDTNMRQAVTPAERLTLTLRYLTTGESYRALSCQFRISHNLISSIVPSVCKAIYKVLHEKYIKLPTRKDDWCVIASDFLSQWNFPLCIGALNSKRILISKPPNSGSNCYDYKGHFSISLLALVDADCKFMYADVAACGRASDSQVWGRCTLKQAVENNMLDIPQPTNMPLSENQSPYVFVGDETFPLKEYLMKPYPERDQTAERRIFNYRLSRARRTSENAFGILTARFQVFKQPIKTSPETAQDITLAAVALHNMLRETSRHSYTPPGFLDVEDTHSGTLQTGQMHQYQNGAVEALQAIGRGHTNNAKNVREKFKGYFNNEGKVHWQDCMASMH